MKWLDWFENNKEAYARDKHGRGYASLMMNNNPKK